MATYYYGNGSPNYYIGDANFIYGYGAGDNLTGTNIFFTTAIYGGSGNDKLYLDFGAKGSVSGGNGNDFIGAGIYADYLTGAGGNDRIQANNGADTVYGGSGNDQIYGNVKGFNGPDLGDLLFGGSGNDRIWGQNGSDFIYGNNGNDKLTGGPGFDNFVFNTSLNAKTNLDTITDFNVKQDLIYLDNTIFDVGSPGFLHTKQFHIGSKANDPDQRIVYNSKTGALYYDSNGSHSGHQVKFAILDDHLNMVAGDFSSFAP
jgi:serralysin